MRSFDADPAQVGTGPLGQKAHRRHIAHSERLERRLYTPRPGVWCLVGNGLSNQTFIEGPGGLIAIDTGESVEEMRTALAEVRAHTSAPLAAVLYSHFHYIGGTTAALDDAGRADLPILGHERIPLNLARTSGEIGPAYSRGLIHQFGLRLPPEGPDALVNEGLGLHFRNPEHAPFTPGYAPPTVFFGGGERLTLAGLTVEVHHAPSDADDSVTFWFPELSTCVQNLVWPTLFNVFAIRGEEYRDPQVLLAGIDHILSLGAAHLVGAHGPPISGAAGIAARVTRYRDSIQFLWDQTVRGLNRGRTADALAHEVRLPAVCDDDYLTSEFYGVAEHHVRQIAAGLRGWFDGEPGKLFVLPPAERAQRLVEGFGGAGVVRAQAEAARGSGDLRWALVLASWLAGRPGAEADDRALLAGVLRTLAQGTSAANIRNWCLTRALELEGALDLSRLAEHRLRPAQLAARPPRETFHLMRVMIDPDRAEGIDHHVRFDFPDAAPAGLHVRNGVSVATDGAGAGASVAVTWVDLIKALCGQTRLSELEASGAARLSGDAALTRRALAAFDLPGLGR
ncbi:MAG: alkyl sulfatase dimerization domain-containing protein [Phenylobacterium sp.]|jgi:alkyl sulfatase BDS1-like metallo-beta-lactamase superfamily hydrolase|uniref:alkyl sulfatase dimerization domain-containing protein n=2 Tax=Phenylobacterium sp. TaxID=1871053 RepID=UPI00391F09EC